MDTSNRLVSTYTPAQHRRHPLQIAFATQLDAGQLAVEFFDDVSADTHWQVELLHERILEPTDPAMPVE